MNHAYMESNIHSLSVELGKRFRVERKRISLNQNDVANICKVSSRTVISWEKGVNPPNLMHLFRLSEKGFNVNTLLDRESLGEVKNNIHKNPNFLIIYSLGFKDFIKDQESDFSIAHFISQINEVLLNQPTWNLVNIQPLKDKQDNDLGIRLFYKFPTPIASDENHSDISDAHHQELSNEINTNKGDYQRG